MSLDTPLSVSSPINENLTITVTVTVGEVIAAIYEDTGMGPNEFIEAIIEDAQERFRGYWQGPGWRFLVTGERVVEESDLKLIQQYVREFAGLHLVHGFAPNTDEKTLAAGKRVFGW